MVKAKKYKNFIYFILASLFIYNVYGVLKDFDTLNVEALTYLSSLLVYISLILIILIAIKNKKKENIPKIINYLVLLWLFYLIFNLIRGAFLAENYWEWKELFLSILPFSLLPLVYYLSQNLEIANTIFGFVTKYLFQWGFILIPLTLFSDRELYSRLMASISLFILFLPYCKPNKKILIIIVALTSVFIILAFRSNLLRISFSFILLLVYYFRKYISVNWFRILHFIFFALPVIFATLAISGEFNILAEIGNNQGVEFVDNTGVSNDIFHDDRTFLYSEVFGSFISPIDIIIGKSAIGYYISDWFYDDGGAINGKRFGTEVGILNIFLKGGITGVIIYLFLMYIVTWYAINRSSNNLSKLLGIFIAFRFTYSFIEEFTNYDMNCFFVWIAVGLISSPRFRNMSDKEISSYFKLI